jgi:hypothetical protein
MTYLVGEIQHTFETQYLAVAVTFDRYSPFSSGGAGSSAAAFFLSVTPPRLLKVTRLEARPLLQNRG